MYGERPVSLIRLRNIAKVKPVGFVLAFHIFHEEGNLKFVPYVVVRADTQGCILCRSSRLLSGRL